MYLPYFVSRLTKAIQLFNYVTKLLAVNGQLLISCYEQLKMISKVAIVVSDGTLECLSVCGAQHVPVVVCKQ